MPVVADADRIRPSSTVVVARAAATPEIFMVRRHESCSFGSAYAFPGGVVDPEDSAVCKYCHGLGDAQANVRLGIESGGLDFYSAAIRELFEEAGVLLARLSDLDEDLTCARAALNDGSLNWAEFVSRHAISLNCSELHYISHWITPPIMRKRYSTRFFLTPLPAGQRAVHCGGELTDSRWATATDLLAAGRRGDIKLHYPTIKTLESIARHKTLEALVEWARCCVQWGITTMVPLTIERNGKQEIVLPGDKDYPGARS